MSDARLVVLVIAAAMIGIGGLATAWTRAGATPEGRAGEAASLEMLWRILPMLFLGLLVWLSATQA